MSISAYNSRTGLGTRVSDIRYMNKMATRRYLCFALALGAFAASALAEDPENGPNLPAQAAADALREYTGSDGAFLAAGQLKGSSSKESLSTLLAFPTDPLVVVSLTGAQVRQAFERSVSLYPQASPFFLQLSGFEVTFHKGGASGSKIAGVLASTVKLDDAKKYTIAMSSSLARGAYGYFKVWDRTAISRTFENVTLESVLKGRAYVDTKPRYNAID